MSSEKNLEDIENLRQTISEKINFGDELIQAVKKQDKLEGIEKLERKILQELSFLRKVLKVGHLKKEYIQCSNLTHFSAVINRINATENVTSISRVIMLDNRKITVDIVCDDNLTWIKVIARNPKSLSQVCMGDTSYGVRSVLDQAEDYIQAAKCNPRLFQIPKILFVFVNGVGYNLAAKIESLGIKVEGVRLKDADINAVQESCRDSFDDIGRPSAGVNYADFTVSNVSNIMKVNLDVSAMLAYVSSVCNGSCDLYTFSVQVLAQQAEWERQRPQKPILDNFFRGKKLFCCETARDSFISIVNIVGGPNEKLRATDFLKRVTVLPDDATIEHVTERGNNECFINAQLTPEKILTIGGKIKERSLKIFTFGDRIGAVTITSNDGFVRAAKQQGICFVVFVHESRALTEQKEQTKAIYATS